MQFLFAGHTLDTDTRELRRGAEVISVQPLVFDLLVYLIENRDRVVTREDLLGALWGGRVVADSTLATHINAARRAIGDSGEAQKLIRTVPAQGTALRRRGANRAGRTSARAGRCAFGAARRIA